MSPFLIFLVALGLAANTVHAAESTPTPDPHAEFEAAVKEYRDAADKVKGNALKSAMASIKEATADLREEAHDQATEAATASSSPSKVIKIRKHDSSSDEDMVFAAIPIVAIVFTFLYLIVRALMAPFSNRNKRMASFPSGPGNNLTEEEAALMEKLQRTLAQMESRVESLETILIDQSRTKVKYGTKL